jgi:DNA-binding CsgD family transcriptional regulator
MDLENKKKHTFSSAVLKRMMDDAEYEAFWAKYRAHRKSGGMRNRFTEERLPLTDKESKFLYEYLTSTGKTIRELGELYGYAPKSVSSQIRKLAVQVLWLNKDKLEF